jgi:hypothetical protein
MAMAKSCERITLHGRRVPLRRPALLRTGVNTSGGR